MKVIVLGNEAVSDPSLYDWDGTDFNMSFVFNSTARVTRIYIYSDQNLGGIMFTNGSGITWYQNTTDTQQYYKLNSVVNFDIGNTGNRSIFIRAQDETGWNSSWTQAFLFVDEEDPTLTLASVTELNLTWTIHPDVLAGNGTVYFSNQMGPSNAAGFDVTVNAADSGSGMTNGYVDFQAFEGIPAQTNTYTGTFSVDQSTTDRAWIRAYAIDASGRNSSSIAIVEVIRDTSAPTLPIITTVVENSEYLFFNSGSTTLYYSNDQIMSAIFTIRLTTTDVGGAGLANATGSADFGGEIPTDTVYSGRYDISYTVSQSETAGGDNQVIVTVYDLVGNSIAKPLASTIDNAAPSLPVFTGVVESSENIHYNGTHLFYSNDQLMADLFTIQFTTSDGLGAGLQNATGTPEFGGEIPFDVIYSAMYEISYTISGGETAGGNNINISVYDFVGNYINATFKVIPDNTAPSIPIITGISETSEFIYFDGSSILYYSNDQSMSDSFTIQFTTDDALADLQNATGSSDFGEVNRVDTTYTAGYELTYTIDQSETAGGDNQIVITVYDMVGNSITTVMSCVLDNGAPTVPTITGVLETSEYIAYIAPILYYSNDQPMGHTFTIQLTTSDGIVGLKNATGSLDFGGETPGDNSYAGSYEITYDISQGDNASADSEVNITVYDLVGNFITVALVCTLDNLVPTTPTISNIIESSDFLYYDGAILYYANTAPLMSEPFTIQLTTSDTISGLQNATGELEFGETNVVDLVYSGGYELTYTVDNGETAIGNQISVTVYDNVGNFISINLDAVLDNIVPTGLSINSILESSEYIYYNNSGNGELFFSNDQSMNDPFTIKLSALEYLSGIQNVTGSFDFGESRSSFSNASGTFDLTYSIASGETTTASDGTLTLTVYDNVGNNASLTLTVTLDNTAPSAPSITNVWESSEYLHYNSPILYYSNDQPMSDSFTIQFITSDSGAGLLNATGETDFGGDTPNDLTYASGYNLTYTVSQAESASGGAVGITVFDGVGNSVTVSLTCTLDNTAPTLPTITNIVESSEYIHYNTPNLYYSSDQAMSDQFTIRFSTSDAIAGLQNATGELEFGETNVVDLVYSGGYELTYTIDNGETANGNQITITVYDMVGNSVSIALSTILDDTSPTLPSIVNLVETSEHLYYDGATFYYSNDQTMNDPFIIIISTSDSVSGLKNATGETEFGNTPSDTVYSAGFELTYTVDNLESVTGGQITITVYDMVGNAININLPAIEDNLAPKISLLNTAVRESSDFAYYPLNGTQVLYYSNKMSTDVTVYINVTTSDGSSGLQVTEFPSLFNVGSAFNTTVYNQSYVVSNTSGDNGTFTFRSFDNVGNIALITLEIVRDNQAPDQSVISAITESSQYLYTSGVAKLWYSDLMGGVPVSVGIDINGIDQGGSLAAGLAVITFPTIGDESPGNITSGTSTYSVTYNLSSTDSTTGDLFFTVYDRVGNTYQIPLEVINDITIPTISFADVTNPLYDPDANELDNTGNWYDQGVLSGGFSVSSTPTDPLSGSRQGSGVFTVFIDWDSTNDLDDNLSINAGADGDEIITGLTDDGDGNIVITLTAYDNVANFAQTSITIRFDNTKPSTVDSTLLDQNGPIISLSGQASDASSGVQKITFLDYNGSHFPTIISSGFASWSLDNTSALDGIIPAGQNMVLNVTVFDNVNNKDTYNVTITFHTLKFLAFSHNIPKRVEIDDPNPLDWKITIDFEYDGILAGSGTTVIDRFIDLTQFKAWINDTSLAIKPGSLVWLPGPQLQFTVILPNSSSTPEVLEHLTIGETYLKNLRVEWNITTPSIDVRIGHNVSNVVSYHDLEIWYINDDLDITETDNPDIMNLVLQFRKDYQPLDPFSGDLTFLVNGGSATLEGGISPVGTGTGNWNVPIRLPSGLTPGLHSISFSWRYNLGEYYYVIDSNTSSNIVNYHDIDITVALPAPDSFRIFEIDSDFSSLVYFNITEDKGDGNGPQPVTSRDINDLLDFRIRGVSLLSQTSNFLSGSGGSDYSFNFTLFDTNTTFSWIGNNILSFRINTSTGLSDWGSIILIGHDLVVLIESLLTEGGLNIFDPDELTRFDMVVRVKEDRGFGFQNVTGLKMPNFASLFMENVGDPNQNATIGFLDSWISTENTTMYSEYLIKFTLQALEASKLSLGRIKVTFELTDHEGHHASEFNTGLESKDFVNLLGLQWITTPFGNFTFDSSNATSDITFRLSLDQVLHVHFRIFALDTGLTLTDPIYVYWETPWNTSQPNPLPILRSGHVTLNLTSSQPYRQAFIAYAEGNREKQLQFQPWRFYVEWDRMVASNVTIDDYSASTDNNSVLNVGGNYTLIYTALFDQSGKGAGNSQLQLNLSVSEFIGIGWTLVDGSLIEHLANGTDLLYPIVGGLATIDHLDGTGSRFFSINNGTQIIGLMIINDTQNVFPFGDGQLQIDLQFFDLAKVDLTVRPKTEIESGVLYRYYSSYPPYSGPVFSLVNNTSAAIFQDTLIWTKLIVTLTSEDGRIPKLTTGTIYADVAYAHDSSWVLDDQIRVFLLDNTLDQNRSEANWINNRATFTGLLSQGIVELVKYNISAFVDSRYGIFLFEDAISGSSDAYTEMIWDQVIFEFSFAEPWGADLRFNVNTSAIIQVKAYYAYDKTPFNGTILTRHRNIYTPIVSEFTFARNWNDSVVIKLKPAEQSGPGTTLFLLINVTADYNWGLNGTRPGLGYRVIYGSGTGSKFMILRWDRIIMQFEHASSYNPGDSLNMILKAYYESTLAAVNTSNFVYTVYKDGQLYSPENRSVLSFSDHEMHPRSHIYMISFAYDSRTNLTGAFNSITKAPFPSNVVTWIDNQKPRLVEQKLIDFGNGTLGFLVIASDDLPEIYFGSGIENVTVQLIIGSQPPGTIWRLRDYGNMSSGVIFFGNVTTESSGEDFEWNSTITYRLFITDKNGNLEFKAFRVRLIADLDPPEISNVKVTYSNESDGSVTIEAFSYDEWAGLLNASIIFRTLGTLNWSAPVLMNLSLLDSDNNGTFSIPKMFAVGANKEYRIVIFDRAGNSAFKEGLIQVLDRAGPQVLQPITRETFTFEQDKFGEFFIRIQVVDNGSEIENAILLYEIAGTVGSIELTEVSGNLAGEGSSILAAAYRDQRTFSRRFTIQPDLINTQFPRFSLLLKDSEGNQRTITDSQIMAWWESIYPQDTRPIDSIVPGVFQLIEEPLVLMIMAVFILGFAFVAIQRFRTISGFDKKKVLQDITKVSDTEVWEENDKISIGLTASFFDQVKGPQPIIVYPDRLWSSEMMIVSLADRSFSTLGFVANPNEDKHATFRYHISGEKCTVFGYAFAIENPEARGGQENLAICFVIRPPWGTLENLNRFLNELLENMQRISNLMKEGVDTKIVQKEMEKTRDFLTRAMLVFRRKYKKEFVE
ncbi:MAG: hypothetical protein ACFFE8_06280 [Candidatus Heimdallarchaeota archaeon]